MRYIGTSHWQAGGRTLPLRLQLWQDPTQPNGRSRLPALFLFQENKRRPGADSGGGGVLRGRSGEEEEEKEVVEGKEVIGRMGYGETAQLVGSLAKQ